MPPSSPSERGGVGVSVVVPVYDDQRNLEICLSALARQTLAGAAFEVVVVDNGSRPAMVLPDLPALQARLVQCPTAGSYAARNAGARLARGEVIAFLDADCAPAPDWLETGLDALRSAPPQTLIGGEVQFVASENPGAVELFQRLCIPGQRHNIEQQKFSVTANLFVRKAEALDIGEFDERLYSGGDKEWCWRALGRGFELRHCPGARVATAHRKTLAAAIRSTRRVTGGQYRMRERGLAAPPAPNDSPPGFLRRLRQSGLPPFDRARVLAVAVVLKIVQRLEIARLAAGVGKESRA